MHMSCTRDNAFSGVASWARFLLGGEPLPATRTEKAIIETDIHSLECIDWSVTVCVYNAFVWSVSPNTMIATSDSLTINHQTKSNRHSVRSKHCGIRLRQVASYLR